MSDTPLIDPVQAQYERWVYPPRAHDLSIMPLDAPEWHHLDMRTLYWLFWPAAPYRDDLDILVAGCGSLAAAAQAYLFPRSRVVGIDISRASLAHQETLKNKHNLTNLTLYHCPVEDVASLNADFDFIICYGVLHHLVDPAAGLRALGKVLRPDGVIDIMVYGQEGRVGVTMLQKLFRVMGLNQDPAGVQAVKETLAALPSQHPVQNFRRLAARDLAYDEGLVDTFLHRRDQPFTCAGCLDLTQEAGLVFQGWKENGLYHLDARLAAQDPLWNHVRGLDLRSYWQAVEMLDATIAAHWFHVCRPERSPASYIIRFNDDAFLDYIPVARVSQTTAADTLQGALATIARPPFPVVGLDEWRAAVFSHIDGIKSVRECLSATGLTLDAPATMEFGRDFFSFLWRIGYVLFRFSA
jgi:SAM-dependent methyltransferase